MAAQGLTGVAYLEADYADPQRNPPLEIDWRPRYPYVPSTLSRITQLGESVEKILRGIENVDLGRLVDGIEKSLTAITKVTEGANLDKLGKEANAFLSEVRDTNRQLKAVVGSAELKSVMQDGAGAAKRAREIIDNAEKPVKQLLVDLPQASEGLARLVKRLDSVATDLPETSAQLRQTIQRMNRLIASQQRDIERTMDNLRAISDNMKEHPGNSKKYPSQVSSVAATTFEGHPTMKRSHQRICRVILLLFISCYGCDSLERSYPEKRYLSSKLHRTLSRPTRPVSESWQLTICGSRLDTPTEVLFIESRKRDTRPIFIISFYGDGRDDWRGMRRGLGASQFFKYVVGSSNQLQTQLCFGRVH